MSTSDTTSPDDVYVLMEDGDESPRSETSSAPPSPPKLTPTVLETVSAFFTYGFKKLLLMLAKATMN